MSTNQARFRVATMARVLGVHERVLRVASTSTLSSGAG